MKTETKPNAHELLIGLRVTVAQWVAENAPAASYLIASEEWWQNGGFHCPSFRVSVHHEGRVISSHVSLVDELDLVSFATGLDADANLRHLTRIRLGA